MTFIFNYFLLDVSCRKIKLKTKFVLMQDFADAHPRCILGNAEVAKVTK